MCVSPLPSPFHGCSADACKWMSRMCRGESTRSVDYRVSWLISSACHLFLSAANCACVRFSVTTTLIHAQGHIELARIRVTCQNANTRSVFSLTLTSIFKSKCLTSSLRLPLLRHAQEPTESTPTCAGIACPVRNTSYQLCGSDEPYQCLSGSAAMG